MACGDPGILDLGVRVGFIFGFPRELTKLLVVVNISISAMESEERREAQLGKKTRSTDSFLP